MLVGMKNLTLTFEARSTTTEASYAFLENPSTQYQKFISRKLASPKSSRKLQHISWKSVITILKKFSKKSWKSYNTLEPKQLAVKLNKQ